VLNELTEQSDCILVLGYRLTHNGTAGFKLRLPREVLVHVDTDPEALEANYPAAVAVRASVRDVLPVLRRGVADRSGSDWTDVDVAHWRRRLTGGGDDVPLEPRVSGGPVKTVQQLFGLLREALPPSAILVTDSGLHQVLARRHYEVLAPRGLLVPSDYQSMGFGIPAAIGAKLGAPDRPVVALVGDGGFAMTGMELLTAVRERIPVTVVVFNDGQLNLIRLQQQGAYGRTASIRLHNPDFAMMAQAMGAEYRLLDGPGVFRDIGDVDRQAVTVIEVPLGDSGPMVRHRFAGLVRATAKRTLGPALVGRIKAWLGRP
jgi:acetolactate synthase-1/2/3 large subunit